MDTRGETMACSNLAATGGHRIHSLAARASRAIEHGRWAASSRRIGLSDSYLGLDTLAGKKPKNSPQTLDLGGRIWHYRGYGLRKRNASQGGSEGLYSEN